MKNQILVPIFMLFIFGVFNISILFTSCHNGTQEQTSKSNITIESKNKNKNEPKKEITLHILTNEEMANKAIEFVYDGCNYVRFAVGRKGYMSHKGNCKNTIHKNVNKNNNNSTNDVLDSIYFSTQSKIKVIESLMK